MDGISHFKMTQVLVIFLLGLSNTGSLKKTLREEDSQQGTNGRSPMCPLFEGFTVISCDHDIIGMVYKAVGYPVSLFFVLFWTPVCLCTINSFYTLALEKQSCYFS